MKSVRVAVVRTVTVVAMLLGAYHLGAQAPQPGTQESQHSQPQRLTLQGDVALWTVAIKPDKTADFEKVLARARDALQKSENPQRKQQAAGWRVMKMEKPLADGNIAYVHIVSPVVTGADYTILKAIYDEFPDESQPLYALYRDAFAQNLALATGSIVIDMSKLP
jgi:hypothetical protein